MVNPYLTLAKQYVRTAVLMPWQHGWMWSVEIEDPTAPENFDIYVKDVSFGAGSIDTDFIQIGSGGVAVPTFSNAGEITMTVRDNQSRLLDTWFDYRLSKVKNDDGTLNIPANYVFNIKLYTLNDVGVKTLYKTYPVYPIKKGDLNWSKENGASITSFPIIFQKFSTVGSKKF